MAGKGTRLLIGAQNDSLARWQGLIHGRKGQTDKPICKRTTQLQKKQRIKRIESKWWRKKKGKNGSVGKEFDLKDCATRLSERVREKKNSGVSKNTYLLFTTEKGAKRNERNERNYQSNRRLRSRRKSPNKLVSRTGAALSIGKKIMTFPPLSPEMPSEECLLSLSVSVYMLMAIHLTQFRQV